MIIGVLALQGDFKEHCDMLKLNHTDISVIEIRQPKHFEGIHGLIIPGGESTSISLQAINTGLFPLIKDWIDSNRPTFGTCAGLILMSDKVLGASKGQLFFGGLKIETQRNFYGSQADSFQAELDDGSSGVFIRAPSFEVFDKSVEILAELKGKAVAVRQGNLIATTFHPELCGELKWHKLFVEIIRKTLCE